MTPIDIIADVSKQLLEKQKALIEIAQRELDLYWDWFTAENTRISALHKTGQATKESGPHVNPIAPVIEYRGNAGYSLKKPYIVWKNFSPKLRRNLKAASNKNVAGIAKGASMPIHSYNSTDVTGPIRSHCTWNAQRAIELEMTLIPIRESLNGIHELIKKNGSTTRKLERLMKTKGESS